MVARDGVDPGGHYSPERALGASRVFQGQDARAAPVGVPCESRHGGPVQGLASPNGAYGGAAWQRDHGMRAPGVWTS